MSTPGDFDFPKEDIEEEGFESVAKEKLLLGLQSLGMQLIKVESTKENLTGLTPDEPFEKARRNMVALVTNVSQENKESSAAVLCENIKQKILSSKELEFLAGKCKSPEILLARQNEIQQLVQGVEKGIIPIVKRP